MDKQTIGGFLLIALVLMIWMWIQVPPPGSKTTTRVDSTKQETHVKEVSPAPSPVVPKETGRDSLGKFFSHLAAGREKVVTIKTDLYTAEISTKGGLIRSWELTRFKTWRHDPVELVDYDHGGDFSILFTTSDGRLINTRNLDFTGTFPRSIELSGDDTYTIDLILPVSETKRLTKRYVFTNGKYSFSTTMIFENLEDVIANYEYQIVWEHGLNYAERNSVNESSYAKAYAFSGGELAEIDATSASEPANRDFNGATSWVATRNKYFAVAMLPEDGNCQGVYMHGEHHPQPDKGVKETYSIGLKMPFKGGAVEKSTLTVFIGPLDFAIVKSYGRNLENIMTLGAAWIIRPITEYVMIPLFTFLKMLIPNFGIVIIVFSIIIKVVLHPLSRTSMQSMKKMQALQPMMEEIRQKHKDDSQKMNQQLMNLYKEYGVNPAAGCLPLIIQLPILYALYSIFSSSIELRQAEFVAWITDLSVPDIVATLPVAIPIFSITEVSGLALAIGVTMFVQQKMTVTDPRQKTMVWMMPILMTLLFNGFPSGLNLYYFVFNLLSIAQQSLVNKRHAQEPLRKVDPKKSAGGILGRLTKDLPKLNR